METHKVRFLKDLLRRRDESSAERYVEAMTGMIKRARNCYAETLVISDEEFLDMMVLDGCFIVELIHKFDEGSWHDLILNVCQIYTNILKDLRLVENQLPFFVLCDLFDIKFEHGTLKIPAVTSEDASEILYRTIIACEQFDDKSSPKYLSEYLIVMDCFINTGKDVELLCHKGIIDNWLGADEEVAEMLNRLGTEVIVNKKNFFYAKLFNDVNKHYHTPWNKRMASLRHNYFNTPWALISFLAASFLLLLSLLQTTFTIFPRAQS